LPTMMWSCTEMPSGVAIWTIALVACDGVGSPEGVVHQSGHRRTSGLGRKQSCRKPADG
jgi:hypothetical protein